jgi:hypothetical protein
MLLIRSFCLQSLLVDGRILQRREDIITTAQLTIIATSAQVPLVLLVEHHVTRHMGTLPNGIAHAIRLGATLVADEDHLAATVLQLL